ncbi:MAG: ABC transporter substrate-binding protein [Candidatus Heimdallarchaeaceae archaeon]|jgi:ABC-type transport system substrate-binding protein
MKNKIFITLLTFCLLIVSNNFINASETDVQEAFSINFLTPDIRPDRVQASNLVADHLALIGIDVVNNIANWDDTGSRVWGYPVGFTEYDYIPVYENGGYDIVFIGWVCLPWFPSGRYDANSITPTGDNFYQYSNATMDSLIDDFTTETDPLLKENYAHHIQAILYEDLPDIPLYYYSENSPLNGSFQEMAINMKHPVIGTGELTPKGTSEAARNLRKAISHAVPRNEIISDILEGEGIAGITSCHPDSDVFDSDLEPYAYNLTLAREYMKKAGFGEGETTSYSGLGIFMITIAGIAIFTILRKNKR